MSFFELSGIKQQEIDQAEATVEAFNVSRNSKAISGSDYKSLRIGNKEEHHSANTHSRLIFSESLCEELGASLCSDQVRCLQNKDVFFVTLLDVRCATQPRAIPDLKRYKSILRRGLRGMSYVGMMDVAFYVNLVAGSNFRHGKRCFFWHLHAMVWGITLDEMKKRIHQINRSGEMRAIIRGLKGAHAKRVRTGDLPKVAAYILKSPTNAYRVSRKDRFDKDGKPMTNEDGEVVAQFRQKKAQLRHGERVNLFNVRKQLLLTDLVLSGGEGCRITARAKRELSSTK